MNPTLLIGQASGPLTIAHSPVTFESRVTLTSEWSVNIEACLPTAGWSQVFKVGRLHSSISVVDTLIEKEEWSNEEGHIHSVINNCPLHVYCQEKGWQIRAKIKEDFEWSFTWFWSFLPNILPILKTIGIELVGNMLIPIFKAQKSALIDVVFTKST